MMEPSEVIARGLFNRNIQRIRATMPGNEYLIDKCEWENADAQTQKNYTSEALNIINDLAHAGFMLITELKGSNDETTSST